MTETEKIILENQKVILAYLYVRDAKEMKEYATYNDLFTRMTKTANFIEENRQLEIMRAVRKGTEK